ncbi:hypothetical protein SAMN04489712_108105 [Thermomonospora echinospora]|uniref:DUF2330 domain-containing protein n=1 Tax=Thermomonospora echinospora TaxID=1992 RepID=A0A1H6BXR1_9ACTN|nr:DUF2330 domain-containing protein [Thermomonospora echinospora]SEG65432.1 hypothetical protein SAMN04489712_108105 [Thermomonospora echinospora]
MRVLARLSALVCLLVAWTAVGLVRPSWSCGCGAMVTSDSADLLVGQETSIVRYDDRTRTEHIVMRLSVRSKARDAAWLFPTPSTAEVKLGERSWFEQLDRLTEPKVVKRRHWWGRPGGGLVGGDGSSAGAPPGGVAVLGEQRLGPFQVATLAADDSRALAGWLERNGYRLSDRLADGLRPYVRMGWKYVAVKLAPGAGGRLNGDLDPLHVSFRSDEIVYPMRLSRLASNDQAVHLYVLGAHRVAHHGPRGHAFGVTFAGWVEPRQVAAPGLRDFLGGRLFLTEVINQRLAPDVIDDDFRYRYTEDLTHREVRYEDEYLTVLGVPAGYAIVLGALGGVAVVVAGVIAVRRRGAAG